MLNPAKFKELISFKDQSYFQYKGNGGWQFKCCAAGLNCHGKIQHTISQGSSASCYGWRKTNGHWLCPECRNANLPRSKAIESIVKYSQKKWDEYYD